MDARAVCSNGVRERSPRELGRVRYGVASNRDIDRHDFSRCCCVDRTGNAVVSCDGGGSACKRDRGPFLTEEKGFDVWKDKLAERILLYGKSPTSVPDPKPLLEYYDAAKLQQIFDYPLNGDFREQHVFPETPQEWTEAFKADAFQQKVAKFFADQGAVAVFVPSYAGDGGIMRDDNNESSSQYVYLPGHKQPIPSAVLANEAFGLLQS